MMMGVLAGLALVSTSVLPIPMSGNLPSVITAADYPLISRRAGEEGNVTVVLVGGTDGRVTGCSVTQTSRHPRLDRRACAVMLERGQFATARPPGAEGLYHARQTVQWRLPLSAERPLFLRVTLASHEVQSDRRVRCVFSDRLVTFVVGGTDCAIAPPTRRQGTAAPLDMVGEYTAATAAHPDGHRSFAVATILSDHGYFGAAPFYQQASAAGIGLASLVLCVEYAQPNDGGPNDDGEGLFDPAAAVRSCLLALDQGEPEAVLLLQPLIAAHPDLADAVQTARVADLARAYHAPATKADLAVPGGTVLATRDYPKDALRSHLSGLTAALVRVDVDGRAHDCLIEHSSLSASLDETVCRRLLEMAKFTPAMLDGQPVAEWGPVRVRWKLGGWSSLLDGSMLGVALQLLLRL